MEIKKKKDINGNKRLEFQTSSLVDLKDLHFLLTTGSPRLGINILRPSVKDPMIFPMCFFLGILSGQGRFFLYQFRQDFSSCMNECRTLYNAFFLFYIY